MNENTGIRIEAVREVSNTGEEGFRITSIKALSSNQLPPLYLQGNRPVVWQRQAGIRDLLIKPDGTKANTTYLSKSFYTEKEMATRLRLIVEAGQHLTDANAKLKEKREKWQGKVVFVDGVEVQNGKTARQQPPNEPIELAERIADLWGEGKLLYRDEKGHIKPLKPLK